MLIKVLFYFVALGASASSKCNVASFIQSPEGQEKLSHMLDRTKSLIISKLTDLDFKEVDIEIVSQIPKKISDSESRYLEVRIKGKENFQIWGEGIFLKKRIIKVISKKSKKIETHCGLEITFSGGNLLNKHTGQDFGSLGQVKEFVRFN